MMKLAALCPARKRPTSLFPIVTLLVIVALAAANFPVWGPAEVEARSIEPARAIVSDFARTQLSFIPNAGQTDPSVVFQTQNLGGSLFFRSTDVVITLPDQRTESDEMAAHVVNLQFEGANSDTSITGGNKLPGTVNYFIGNDPAQWVTNLTTYSEIVYEQLYPGIDLHYNGTQGVLKGTYVVASGANPSQIRWSYGGVRGLRLDPAVGDLIMAVDTADSAQPVQLIEHTPVAWQTINDRQVTVNASYVLNEDNSVRFELGDYDPAYPLIVDPDLQYGTFLGGEWTDQAYSIAADTSGNAYVVGGTNSPSFPYVLPIQGALQGDSDAFVSKLNSSGQLVFSTFFGGTGFDEATGVAIDSTGIYFTGETDSGNFPTSSTAFQTTLGGGTDVFVSKLTLTGSAILYSTFLGGLENERANAIAVTGGFAHVTGLTSSSNFPIAAPLYGQPTPGGSIEAFVSKLNNAGQGLLFSTYLGGNGVDVGNSIAIGPASSVYIAGHTTSTDFPTSVNALSRTLSGGTDGFVTKLNDVGGKIFYSTYLGSAFDDAANDLAVDPSGNAYITGMTAATSSSPFPAPTGTTLTYHGAADVFVAKLNNFTGAITYSTLIGGSDEDSGGGIALDSSFNMYLTGSTNSANFPVVDPFPGFGTFRGVTDAFVLKITAGTSTLEYSSFLGGSGTLADRGLGIVVDNFQSVLVVGETGSQDMFTDSIRQWGGTIDSFIVRVGTLKADLRVLKVDDELAGGDPKIVGDPITYTITVTNVGPDIPTTTVVTDTLPEEVAFVSASVNPTERGTCSEANLILTCELLNLPDDGTSAVITVNTTIVTGGNIHNFVEVSSDLFDPIMSTNADEEYTNAGASADLVLDMSLPAPYNYIPKMGTDFVYHIAVTNNGPSIASQVRVNDLLPAGVTYKSHTQTAGSYNQTTGVWQISLLDVDAMVTLDIVVTASGTIGTQVFNTANVASSSQFDPDLTNNADGLTITITSGAPSRGCHPSKYDPEVIVCYAGG
jgi:uncharacterized repeat protein (TIGR01451 family)